MVSQVGKLKGTAGVDEPTHTVGWNLVGGCWRGRRDVNDREGATRQRFRCRRNTRGRGWGRRRFAGGLTRLNLVQPMQDRVELLFDTIELGRHRLCGCRCDVYHRSAGSKNSEEWMQHQTPIHSRGYSATG